MISFSLGLVLSGAFLWGMAVRSDSLTHVGYPPVAYFSMLLILLGILLEGLALFEVV